MTAFTAALAVGVGIHLALTLFLLLRYLEGRERTIGWWAIAYGFFTAHLLAETLMTIDPVGSVVALRHALFIAAAWALVQSFYSDWRVTTAAAAGALIAIALVPLSWLAAAVAASALGGAGFVAAAGLLYRREHGVENTSTALLFWGLLLGGLHAFDYPLLRPHPVLAAVGAGFSGLFTIVFGTGIILWALQRTRDLSTLSAISEALNRSLDTREALGRALHQLVELMRVNSGWIFLRSNGEYETAVTENLPLELAADDMARMHGDCRCLQLLREGQLTQAVNIVNCMRLEKAGWVHPRHVTVPLRTADDVIGVMNLTLPRRRALSTRELATLSAIGHEIGLAAERARLYEEVRAKEALRGELLQKLITAHEDERRRIARELHDEAGQALTALILNLQMAEGTAARPADKQQLRRLRGIAEDTLSELRKLIYDLRPTVLDDLGLAAAIRWYVKEMIEPQGLRVEINIKGLEHRIPHHIETAVFRIAQEAFTNILKHAGAHRAALGVIHSDDSVKVTVTDDGQGFDLTAVSRGQQRHGMGLMGMRERAELLGGTWKVVSRLHEGTTVEAIIPVGPADEQN